MKNRLNDHMGIFWFECVGSNPVTIRDRYIRDFRKSYTKNSIHHIYTRIYPRNPILGKPTNQRSLTILQVYIRLTTLISIYLASIVHSSNSLFTLNHHSTCSTYFYIYICEKKTDPMGWISYHGLDNVNWYYAL